MVDLQCSAGYEVTHRIMNAANHGIPHERRRLYICGIRNDGRKERMKWPETIEPCSTEDLLDGDFHSTGLPASPVVPDRGDGPVWIQRPLKLDTRDSSNRYTVWLRDLKRQMTTKEMCRLQGTDPGKIVVPRGSQHIAHIVANSSSLNVMERVMLRLLKAADLIHEDTKDRWEDDSAQKGLRESKTSDFCVNLKQIVPLKPRLKKPFPLEMQMNTETWER